jgi:hypothetical protein
VPERGSVGEYAKLFVQTVERGDMKMQKEVVRKYAAAIGIGDESEAKQRLVEWNKTFNKIRGKGGSEQPTV